MVKYYKIKIGKLMAIQEKYFIQIGQQSTDIKIESYGDLQHVENLKEQWQKNIRRTGQNMLL